MSEDAFLSGRVGYVGPRRAGVARALDRLLDLELRLRRAPARLDALAGRMPGRRVLVLCVYRPRSGRAGALARALRSERHETRLAFGSIAEAADDAAGVTTATRLTGGKFENLNALLRAARIDGGDYDWTLVVDDDVELPERFVDRLLAACEALGLALAQPALTLASHAAWPVTRRRPAAFARQTRFVEIGPVTAIGRDAAGELVPFPELRFGWGLDLHWAALAERGGWRLGVIDALPVRHEQAGVASAYRHEDAVAEAREFLDGRPFLPREAAADAVRTWRRLPT